MHMLIDVEHRAAFSDKDLVFGHGDSQLLRIRKAAERGYELLDAGKEGLEVLRECDASNARRIGSTLRKQKQLYAEVIQRMQEVVRLIEARDDQKNGSRDLSLIHI